ncbi:hypothetical protein KC573_02290 [candidate division WWE3 bacterium]|uniref:ZIP Zinc transporter n=1 Tax=candidate division WWE3 bacterium TaxID=2053526 RepID=A0A955RX27_UNCKA|nr:hypothetical protein [candidate division WWE3 bacterium]
MENAHLLIVPSLLIIGHILTFNINLLTKKYASILKSFAAGFSITYVFMILFPEVYSHHTNSLYSPTILVLGGFILFHVTHSFVFKHHETKNRIFLLDEIHLLIAGFYNFLIAFSIVDLMKIDAINGTIVGVLLVLHALLIDITNTDMTRHTPSKIKLCIILAGSILGSIISYMEFSNDAVTTLIFSITAGAMIYITIREEIPKFNNSRPGYFIVGSLVLLTSILLFY